MSRWILLLTGWVEDHPWLMLGVVGAITLLFSGAILALGIEFKADFKDFLPQDEPAVQALNRAEATYGSQDLFLVAVVAEDTIFKPSTLRKFKEMEERFAEIVGVDEVRGPANSYVIYGTEDSLVVERAMEEVPKTPEGVAAYRERVMRDRNLRGWVISEDGRAGAISIRLDPFEADAPTVVAEIEQIVRRYEGPERIYLAGEPVLRSTISASMIRDLQVLIPFVVLVMILVLFLSFRSLRGVMLPLAVVLMSTIWTVGSMALAGVAMSPFAIIMPVMLIAIGTADGIHILNKYYEEAAKRSGNSRASRRAVVLTTMEEMASPIIMTSLTTAAGFSALMTSFLWPQRMFGLFTALGILYAMVLSFTLIPAILARLPLPKLQGAYEGSPLSGILAGIGRGVGLRPAATLILAVIVLTSFAVAIPKVKVETRPDQFLGRDHPSVQAMYAMEEHFGGSYQLAIEIDTGRRDGLKDPQVLKKILALQEYLEARPEIGRVTSVADIARQLNETLHASDPEYYRIPEDPRLAAQLFLLYGGDPGPLFLGDFSKGEVLARRANIGSVRMAQLVREVQAYLDEHFDKPGSPKAEMVGPTQAYAALLARIIHSQLTSLSASVLAAGLIVALLMFSWAAGLLSLLPLLLTIVVEFGVMAYAGLPLDMGTIMLGSIAIGIGIDYVIHFLSRFRLEIQEGQGPMAAYERTLRTAGKGIVYNALALMLGFAVLLVSSFKGLVNFGFLIMLTMLIASVSSLTVVPAITLKRLPGFLKGAIPISEVETVTANPTRSQGGGSR
jgi:hypothetical protein